MRLTCGPVWMVIVALATVTPWVVGCDRDETASNQPAAQQPSGGGEDVDADETSDANDGDAPAPAAPKATVPTVDAPVPPTVEGDVMKTGFIVFMAKDEAEKVGAFYQKEMEAKGWKLGRNKANRELSNLANVVQEYTKGNDVATVLLQEQPGGEGNLVAGQVMDVPLPPTAERAMPVGGMVTMEVPGGADEVLAWYDKALTGRGWSADKRQDQQNLKAQGFRKGNNRTLTVIVQQFPGRKNCSVQLQHIAYAE